MKTRNETYAMRVKSIREMKIEREKIYDALKGAMESLAKDLSERFWEEYKVEVGNTFERQGITDGIKYRLHRIKPVVEDWRDTLMVGVDVLAERIDGYTPTDKEKKLLATRPKGKPYNEDLRLAFWIDHDLRVREWGQLKNRIFREFTYRWDIFADGVEDRIANQKLDIKPVK